LKTNYIQTGITMRENIVVQCGKCRYFQQNDNPDETGYCFKNNEFVSQKNSIQANTLYWQEILGGVSLYPELNRVCKEFSGEYEFEIEEYVDNE
jgi:hypothetical protein